MKRIKQIDEKTYIDYDKRHLILGKSKNDIVRTKQLHDKYDKFGDDIYVTLSADIDTDYMDINKWHTQPHGKMFYPVYENEHEHLYELNKHRDILVEAYNLVNENDNSQNYIIHSLYSGKLSPFINKIKDSVMREHVLSLTDHIESDEVYIEYLDYIKQLIQYQPTIVTTTTGK